MRKVVEYTIVLLVGVLSVCIFILPHIGSHCYTARWIYNTDTVYLSDKSLTKMEAQFFCLHAHNANGFWEVVKLPEPSYTYPSSAGEVRLFVDTSAELKLVQDRANRMAELTRHTDSMRNLEEEMLRLAGKMQEMKGMRDEYEIKYLHTEDDKYRRLGNKYVDSGHYYYKLLAKLTHQ